MLAIALCLLAWLPCVGASANCGGSGGSHSSGGHSSSSHTYSHHRSDRPDRSVAGPVTVALELEGGIESIDPSDATGSQSVEHFGRRYLLSSQATSGILLEHRFI